MGIFQNTLKPEETIAGFNPGEPDDDIFKLESLPSYPGVLPKFDEPPDSSEIDVSSVGLEEQVSEPEIPDYTSEEPKPAGVDENIYDAPDDGSVWDIFDNPAPQPEAKPVQENVFDDFQEPDYSKPEEPIDYGSFSGGSSDEFDLSSLDDIKPVPEPQVNDSGSLKMDDDLISLLQGDLASGSTTKKEVKPEPEPIPEITPEEFTPVEEHSETVFIDFSDLNAETSAPTNAPKVQAAPITDPSANPNPEPKMTAKEAAKLQAKLEKERKKEQKKANKKPFPWTAFWSSVAIFAMLSMVGVGGYYFWNKYIINHETKTEVAEHETKEEPKEEPKHEEKHENIADTAKTEEHKTDSTLAKEENKEHEAKEEPKVEPKEEHKTLAEKEKPHVKEETPKHDVKKIVEKKDKFVEKKIEIKEKPEKKKETKPVEKKIAKKETKEPKENKPAKEKAEIKAPSGNEVYVVQVYASPSKKDAEAWIKTLEKKGIRSGFLSPQKVRDQIWYRVRFGNYAGKEEARTAALRYGFAQSWVDRVK
eukprot:TRINITY_DN28284_c0_g1_i1.p1 TRINITY_DN28284_c0_g1~~TRINITY_DN28284_c0_g1_i1.p1  ORF type:complete len:533 (-),score=26.71 TRINITY_DN28284_c0_g1_i1:803-2401(-)